VLILGVESSCDETAAAVVEETGAADKPWRVRSNVIASQVALHREWGGVVPELASRQHLRDICGVLEKALEDAGVTWRDLGAVAVTQGPGLVGSLLVGLQAAKSVALSLDLPLVAVHHLAGHIESLVLHNGPMPLPAVVLVVSGGHTSLYLMPADGEYHLIGRTRDDAAGEAYDKVAKLLGLGYPGGPVIDRVSKGGNDRAYDLPRVKITHKDRNPGPAGIRPAGFEKALEHRADFSFSGLKTAVLRIVQQREGRPFGEQELADLCASFQRAVVDALLTRTFEAAGWFGAKSIGIAGGVSANSRLRADAALRGEQAGIPVFVPALSLTTDNAAMIAAAGLRRLRAGVTTGLDVNAHASLPIA
jgi:N6-L-threonylcarbamoyladenine synthase